MASFQHVKPKKQHELARLAKLTRDVLVEVGKTPTTKYLCTLSLFLVVIPVPKEYYVSQFEIKISRIS